MQRLSQEFSSEGMYGERGLLTKLNLQTCRKCAAIFVSPYQSSKIENLPSGWYENELSVQTLADTDINSDVVIRVRGKKKTCPKCQSC